jgi:phosphate/sulfate permease
MKTLTFNRDSWHYKLVNKVFGFNADYDHADICSYTKKVLLAMFIIVVLAAAVLFGIYLAGNFIGYIVASIINFTFIDPNPESVIVGTLLIIGASCWLAHIISNKTSSVSHKISDSFIGEAYKSFKGKYCAKIEFTDKQ